MFANKRVMVSRQGQMNRMGGKLAFSAARKSNDPIIKERDRIRKRLIELNKRIRQKHGQRAMSQVRRMR